MSYSNKQLVRMVFPEHDFGAGAEAWSFRLPDDEHGNTTKGRLVNIGVEITETFSDTSGTAVIQAGTNADPDAFAELDMGNTSADLDVWDVTDDTNAIIDEDIPAGTLVEVNCVASTGGTPAGKGFPFLDIYVW